MKNKILTIDFEIIWKSVHTALNEEEQLLLDQWLAEDDKHRKYYDQVVYQYKQREQQVAPPDVRSLWKEIEAQEKGDNSGRRRWILAAASIALAIATVFVLFNTPTERPADTTIAENNASMVLPGTKKAVLRLGNGQTITLGPGQNTSTTADGSSIAITNGSVKYKDEENVPDRAVTMHEIEIPRGGEFTLTLSDGTQVWLNSQSTLRYPAIFSKDKRVVELTGEAYFEVAHNKNRQFEVIAADQVITVLGTSFNVSHYPEDREIVSTLVEGSIRIDTQTGSNTILSPGEQAVYNKQSNALTSQKVNVANFIAWKNGLFYFENEPLEHIMTVLSRWYDIEVVYKNTAQKQQRFTGTLKRYDTFKNVIGLIEMTHDVKFEIKENVITIE